MTPISGQPSVLWWGTVGPTDVLGLATAAAASGFTGIAVTPTMHQACNGKLDDVRARLDALGVQVTLIDPLVSALPGSPAPDEVPERFRELFAQGPTEAFAAAAAFHATVCVGGFLGQPVTYPQLLASVSDLVEQADQHGVRVLVEFMPGTQIPDLPTALALVRDIGAHRLELVFDTWHFARVGGTTADLRAIPEGVVRSIQVADRDHDAVHRPYVPMDGRLLPGEGDLPLREWLDALLTSSPTASVGVEVFSSELRAEPVDAVAAKAADALRSVLPTRTR